MKILALRHGLHRHWSHLYYPGKLIWDHRHPIPYFHHLKQDMFIKRILNGFYPFSKFEFHKSKGNIDIYIKRDSLIHYPLHHNLSVNRILFNILKSRINIYNLYTFPIHDALLIVSYLLGINNKVNDSISRFSPTNKISPPFKQKSRLRAFKNLWKAGIIKGVKIKIKGRYKKSTRTKNEVYQFGRTPNSPTTNLKTILFYSSHSFIQSLGTSSLHIYIVY